MVFHCVPETKFHLNSLTFAVEYHLLKVIRLILATQVLFSHCDPPKADPTLYHCAFSAEYFPASRIGMLGIPIVFRGFYGKKTSITITKMSKWHVNYLTAFAVVITICFSGIHT